MSERWIYDERQFGMDFDTMAQVEQYESRQHTSPALQKILVGRLGIEPGNVVVEYASGTGAFSMAAAWAGAEVYAVEMSRAMLEFAAHKAQVARLHRIHFAQGGFLTYQHAGPAADFVVTQFALHHLPDFWKGIAVGNIFAMLKPGGKFYLRDVVFSFDPADFRRDIGTWIDYVSGEPDPALSRAGFEAHVREEFSTYGWILEGMLSRAGFLVRAHYDSSTYAEYICTKPG